MSFDNLPPGVKPSDLEPDEERCKHCGEAPCRCQQLEDKMDQRRLEKAEKAMEGSN